MVWICLLQLAKCKAQANLLMWCEFLTLHTSSCTLMFTGVWAAVHSMRGCKVRLHVAVALSERRASLRIAGHAVHVFLIYTALLCALPVNHLFADLLWHWVKRYTIVLFFFFSNVVFKLMEEFWKHHASLLKSDVSLSSHGFNTCVLNNILYYIYWHAHTLAFRQYKHEVTKQEACPSTLF